MSARYQIVSPAGSESGLLGSSPAGNAGLPESQQLAGLLAKDGQLILPLSGRGLDFYHLRDNIHRTRREVFGETEAGGAWAHDLAETFKTDGFTAGWNRLLAWRATLRRRAHQQSADRLITYISDRRELIAYPEFRAQGWDIGSGPTEAQCKTTTSRLKGRGRRWNPANAIAISTIEAVYQSRLHKMFWNLN